MRLFLSFMLMGVCLTALAQRTAFRDEVRAPAPDYADQANWSALPFRTDAADHVPKGEVWVSDSLKGVDVFYVYPTLYSRGPLWNADVRWKKLNRKIDNWPVRMQASVFNASCRVFAPRYRQAVVGVFYSPSSDGDLALDLAYQDVRRAFLYYLEHHNQGRPFIIAGHSQGTAHTRRLLAEFIDTTALRHRMVAAYVIGLRVSADMYKVLGPCPDATATGCYVTWMSYREGHIPMGQFHVGAESINPITWRPDTTVALQGPGIGTVVMSLDRVMPGVTTARTVQTSGGRLLWVRTRAPWFRGWKNLHVADYGLFYMDIRANVKARVERFLK
jgi:hypothetical protein